MSQVVTRGAYLFSQGGTRRDNIEWMDLPPDEREKELPPYKIEFIIMV